MREKRAIKIPAAQVDRRFNWSENIQYNPLNMEIEHQHAGLNADLNGDGLIYMKAVTSNGKIHVHGDKVLP